MLGASAPGSRIALRFAACVRGRGEKRSAAREIVGMARRQVLQAVPSGEEGNDRLIARLTE